MIADMKAGEGHSEGLREDRAGGKGAGSAGSAGEGLREGWARSEGAGSAGSAGSAGGAGEGAGEGHVGEERSQKALAAMSGGVDSSVTALLLLREGLIVTGATMELVANPTKDESESADKSCPPDAIKSAQDVCRRLGIEHMTFDLKTMFEEKVVSQFCSAYITGLTPNPCIECNRYLKFGELHRLRRSLGMDFLATGHYARRRFDEQSGCWQLLRARDSAKDQSYFLYSITQEQLAHTLFPLGDLTKSEVRAIAADAGFPNAKSPESQDICFVGGGDHIAFIEGRLGSSVAPEAFRAGSIVDMHGNRLGTHAGLIRYTAGQRKGIGVAATEPLYVFAKNVSANELVVGTAEEILVSGIKARNINMIAEGSIARPQVVQVKTHYRQKPVGAKAEQTAEDEITVIFDAPQRVAAPGQAAVLYEGDAVIGGGTITECI